MRRTLDLALQAQTLSGRMRFMDLFTQAASRLADLLRIETGLEANRFENALTSSTPTSTRSSHPCLVSQLIYPRYKYD